MLKEEIDDGVIVTPEARKMLRNASRRSENILELPNELAIEILSWLPIRDVVCSRFVCNLWNKMLASTNEYFTSMHFAKSKLHFIIQNPMKLRGRFLIAELREEHNMDSVQLTSPKLEFPSSGYYLVNSVNGLVCSANPCCGPNIYPIEISNPITGEWFNVPPIEIKHPMDIIISGLGVTLESGHYKILGWFRQSERCLIRGGQVGERALLVYTIGTSSWRILPLLVPDHVPDYAGVYLDGAFHWHWIGSSENIVTFHLETEMFGAIPMPLPLRGETNLRKYKTKIGLIDNFLYLRACDELWIMKQYGVQLSWTKLELDFSDEVFNCCRPLKFLSGGKVLLNYSSKGNGTLLSYDPVAKIRKLVKLPVVFSFNDLHYAPSFKPISKTIIADGEVKVNIFCPDDEESKLTWLALAAVGAAAIPGLD